MRIGDEDPSHTPPPSGPSRLPGGVRPWPEQPAAGTDDADDICPCSLSDHWNPELHACFSKAFDFIKIISGGIGVLGRQSQLRPSSLVGFPTQNYTEGWGRSRLGAPGGGHRPLEAKSSRRPRLRGLVRPRPPSVSERSSHQGPEGDQDCPGKHSDSTLGSDSSRPALPACPVSHSPRGVSTPGSSLLSGCGRVPVWLHRLRLLTHASQLHTTHTHTARRNETPR